MKKGKVYLVGAGPGAKDLISLRGQEALQQAETVIYDYLVDREVLESVNPQAELICCDRLGKKQPQEGSFDSQDKVNSAMVKFAKKGKLVVRLKNGDPFIFGRVQEEIEALLKNNIEFEVIPGITAAQAAACFSGIPLTSRKISSSVIYVSGHEARGEKPAIDWRSISKNETIVLYMAVKNIPRIAQQLIKNGKPADTAVAAVSHAGRITQRIALSTLGKIDEVVKKGKIIAPAIFIIGEVVRLQERFDWFKKNKRILFTGLSAKRFFLKGNYFHLPMLKIVPLDSYADFDRNLRKIYDFNWVVFTSRYSVQYFFQRLGQIGSDARLLQDIKIAAIGASTAGRLKDFGIIADLIPKVESSKGLLAALKRIDLKDKKIFLPHSDISDKGVSHGLQKFGAKVTSCVAYKNVALTNLPDLDLQEFDEIIFTSPSGARNFFKHYGRPPRGVLIRCIGEVTRLQAEKLRLL
jgi:uroporphyrinogen III methyltransferase/synthase